MNKEIAKAKATALRTYLGSQGITINHSRALEALARMEGESSYNALQSKFDGSEAPAVPAVTKQVDGPEQAGYDHRAGLLPAYRQARLRVSLWCVDSKSTHLTLDVFELDEKGEVLEGSLVTSTCLRFPLNSGADYAARETFVKNVAQGLASAHSETMPLSEMRWAVEALCKPDAWYGEIFTKLAEQAAERRTAVFFAEHVANAEGTAVVQVEALPASEASEASWDIPVCRKEKADVTIIVRNATRKEAEDEAIGEASSRTLDAHIVDYDLADGDITADEPVVDFVDAAEDPQERHDWEVRVRRISYGFATVKVVDEQSKDMAEVVALDEAAEHDFSNTSERHVVKSMTRL